MSGHAGELPAGSVYIVEVHDTLPDRPDLAGRHGVDGPQDADTSYILSSGVNDFFHVFIVIW